MTVLMDQSIDTVITKAGIQEVGDQLIDRVREGKVDLMKMIVFIKALSKVEEYVLKEAMLDDSLSVKEAVIQTIQEQGQGKQENPKLVIGGVEYEVFESGFVYDYTHDPVYVELKAKLEARVDRLKKCRIPDSTKGIKPEVDENGIELYPPAKKSTTTFRINFKK
jgi:hypothetical protein